MTLHYLNEENLPPKLPIRFSSEIYKEIYSIIDYNQNNTVALSQWDNYIEGIKSYISNRSIAWDYNSRYAKFPNGTRFIRDFDYNVGYTIKQGNKYGTYVYVFMINLKPEEFGLKVPSTLKENKQSIRLTESYLYRIIEESVRSVLKEHRNIVRKKRRYHYLYS